MTEEKIKRINELSRKSKTPEGLTDAEKEEQQALRLEYRQGIISNLSGQLESCVIDDGHGNRKNCLLYTSPSPRDQRGSRMPSSA